MHGLYLFYPIINIWYDYDAFVPTKESLLILAIEHTLCFVCFHGFAPNDLCVIPIQGAVLLFTFLSP